MDSSNEGLPLVNVKNKFGKPNNLARTTSCVSNPQVSALECLKEGNITRLSDLLNGEYGDDLDVNKAYPEDKFKTLLYVAVERSDVEATRLLLSHQADPNLANRLLHKTPLHVAAGKGHVDILSMLLASKANVNAATAEGKTPLHILAKKCVVTDSGEKDFAGLKACLSLLLQQPGLEIDKRDMTGDQTPLYVAATSMQYGVGSRRNYVDVVRQLLSAGADWSLSCGERDGGKSIRSILREDLTDDEFKTLVNVIDAQGLVGGSAAPLGALIRDQLMAMINQAEADAEGDDDTDTGTDTGGWKEFLDKLDLAQRSDLLSHTPGEKNLLQRAAEAGLYRHVYCLLTTGGVDPNMVSSGTMPALILAANNGHARVVEAMRKHKKLNVGVGADFSVLDKETGLSVLHAILRKPFNNEFLLPVKMGGMERRYTRCLQVILGDGEDSDSEAGQKSTDNVDKEEGQLDQEIRLVINSKDELGNTPLHYATQMWSQDIVRLLLEKGANIGMKNAYSEVPVENILPETMEAFLDEFCLQSEGNLMNKNFKITMRYDFLAPPRGDDAFSTQSSASAPASRRRIGWINHDEERGRNYDGERGMKNNEAEKQKPQKSAVTENSLSAAAAAAGSNNNNSLLPLPETEVLWYMSQSKKHRHLLKHPVITSFLWMKWKRITGVYNKNLIFYTTLVACLTLYIFALYGGRSLRAEGVLAENCTANGEGTGLDRPVLPVEVDVLWYANVVLLSVLLLRELLQFCIGPRRYFFSFENWLEVTLIGLTASLLFLGGADYGCQVSAKRHLAALAIVLSWSELITMIGRHPKLSTLNIYVTMFYRVLTTFVLFLAWYSLFILAFGLGFYILLHRDDGHIPEEGEYAFFNALGLCLVKTFTMFVGELEFSDLPIDTPIGYLFFLAFVFLIVVVMMNLLNGLAVSDTAVIRQEAEIHFYTCQVDVISYMESMLLGDPFNFLSNWPSFDWLRRLPSCSLGSTLYNMPTLRHVFHTLTGASRVLLFFEVLPDKRVSFHPNHDYPFCGCLSGSEGEGSANEEPHFPSSVLEAAKAVALQRMKAEDSVEKRLAKTEKLLQLVLKDNEKKADKLDHITKLLSKQTV